MKINIFIYKKGVLINENQAQNETGLLNYLPPHLASPAISMLNEGKVFEFRMMKVDYRVQRIGYKGYEQNHRF